MSRPFTLFTGQWADLPLEEVCRLARDWGYDGLELACWGDHFEVDRALHEDGYLAGRHALLAKYELRCWAISNHLVGQAVCDHTDDAATAGFRRILVTEPGHPYLEAWWPPGHVLGWEHTFVHQARDLLVDIAADDDPEPSFADGLQVQRVLDAVASSAAHDSAWTKIETS